MKFKKLRLRMLKRSIESLKARTTSLWADLRDSDSLEDRDLAGAVSDLDNEVRGLLPQVLILMNKAGDSDE
jgi:hypothetical protein